MASIIPENYSYLKPYSGEINRKQFWENVVAQINKDTGSENAVHVKLEDLQGEEAAEAIVTHLQKQLPAFTPRLSEILYRIDIDEENTKRLKNLPDDLYFRILAEMILKREVMKVLTKGFLSDNTRL
ncbi:MAG: hypothetical protein HKL88_02180 [Bacteroidia bacterium]|jgi:hypothetical protein|nr:hypothetical protein [Bacteroidia bacterium]